MEKIEKIKWPESWSAKTLEVTKNSGEEIFDELLNFVKDMKESMGVFTHLQKYFADENLGVGRIKESIAINTDGARHLSVIKFENQGSVGDIIGVVALVGNDEKKLVDVGIYLEPDAQGRGVAGKYCLPEIKRLYREHFINKGKDYKLVVSNITPQARKMLLNEGVKLIPTSDPEYQEVDFK